jgi:AAA domain-containing protein
MGGGGVSPIDISRELEEARRELARANGARAADTGAATAPAAALATARVDLVELIRGGIPERAYVPGAPFLIRGKRFLLPAPAGAGKSLAALVIGVDVVEARGSAAILDVENGGDEYARRLADVLEARDDAHGTLAASCSERLRYYAYPALRMTWGPEEWAAAFTGVNVVVFDSSRLVLSSAGLAEDRSDDYATFANALLIPLSRANTTTVVLDNTGHNDHDRARGSKAKDDLNETTYVLKVGQEFDRDRSGYVRLVRGRTRFADLPGELHVPLGGGTYGPAREAEAGTESSGFRPTHLMERTSIVVEENPGLSRTDVLALVGGKREYAQMALTLLVIERYVRAEPDGRSKRHHSIRPYRESDDEGPGSHEVPEGSRELGNDEVPGSPSPRREPGTTHPDPPGPEGRGHPGATPRGQAWEPDELEARLRAKHPNNLDDLDGGT